MKLAFLLTLCAALAGAVLAQDAPPARPKPAKARNVFPYNDKIDNFPNGLRLVTVPTDYPNLVAMYIVVQVGSRNEIEPGKSGYAHFFEHLMFRGSEITPPNNATPS